MARRAAPPAPGGPTEAAFQAAIVELAARCGWQSYHTYDSRRSAPGFPDLVLCRAPRLLFVEVKTARGRVRPAQHVWLAALAACPQVEVYLWRPEQWDAIVRVLTAPDARKGATHEPGAAGEFLGRVVG